MKDVENNTNEQLEKVAAYEDIIYKMAEEEDVTDVVRADRERINQYVKKGDKIGKNVGRVLGVASGLPAGLVLASVSKNPAALAVPVVSGLVSGAVGRRIGAGVGAGIGIAKKQDKSVENRGEVENAARKSGAKAGVIAGGIGGLTLPATMKAYNSAGISTRRIGPTVALQTVLNAGSVGAFAAGAKAKKMIKKQERAKKSASEEPYWMLEELGPEPEKEASYEEMIYKMAEEADIVGANNEYINQQRKKNKRTGKSIGSAVGAAVGVPLTIAMANNPKTTTVGKAIGITAPAVTSLIGGAVGQRAGANKPVSVPKPENKCASEELEWALEKMSEL